MCGQLTWHKVRPCSLGSSSSDNVLLVKKGLVLSRGECVLVQHHHGAWCALRRTGRQATVIKLEKEITPPCLYWEQRYRGTPSHPPPPPFCVCVCVFLGVCVSVSLSLSLIQATHEHNCLVWDCHIYHFPYSSTADLDIVIGNSCRNTVQWFDR